MNKPVDTRKTMENVRTIEDIKDIYVGSYLKLYPNFDAAWENTQAKRGYVAKSKYLRKEFQSEFKAQFKAENFPLIYRTLLKTKAARTLMRENMPYVKKRTAAQIHEIANLNRFRKVARLCLAYAHISDAYEAVALEYKKAKPHAPKETLQELKTILAKKNKEKMDVSTDIDLALRASHRDDNIPILYTYLAAKLFGDRYDYESIPAEHKVIYRNFIRIWFSNIAFYVVTKSKYACFWTNPDRPLRTHNKAENKVVISKRPLEIKTSTVRFVKKSEFEFRSRHNSIYLLSAADWKEIMTEAYFRMVDRSKAVLAERHPEDVMLQKTELMKQMDWFKCIRMISNESEKMVITFSPGTTHKYKHLFKKSYVTSRMMVRRFVAFYITDMYIMIKDNEAWTADMKVHIDVFHNMVNYMAVQKGMSYLTNEAATTHMGHQYRAKMYNNTLATKFTPNFDEPVFEFYRRFTVIVVMKRIAQLRYLSKFMTRIGMREDNVYMFRDQFPGLDSNKRLMSRESSMRAKLRASEKKVMEYRNNKLTKSDLATTSNLLRYMLRDTEAIVVTLQHPDQNNERAQLRERMKPTAEPAEEVIYRLFEDDQEKDPIQPKRDVVKPKNLTREDMDSLQKSAFMRIDLRTNVVFRELPPRIRNFIDRLSGARYYANELSSLREQKKQFENLLGVKTNKKIYLKNLMRDNIVITWQSLQEKDLWYSPYEMKLLKDSVALQKKKLKTHIETNGAETGDGTKREQLALVKTALNTYYVKQMEDAELVENDIDQLWESVAAAKAPTKKYAILPAALAIQVLKVQMSQEDYAVDNARTDWEVAKQNADTNKDATVDAAAEKLEKRQKRLDRMNDKLEEMEAMRLMAMKITMALKSTMTRNEIYNHIHYDPNEGRMVYIENRVVKTIELTNALPDIAQGRPQARNPDR
jgi:hypothetical protein